MKFENYKAYAAMAAVGAALLVGFSIYKLVKGPTSPKDKHRKVEGQSQESTGKAPATKTEPQLNAQRKQEDDRRQEEARVEGRHMEDLMSMNARGQEVGSKEKAEKEARRKRLESAERDGRLEEEEVRAGKQDESYQRRRAEAAAEEEVMKERSAVIKRDEEEREDKFREEQRVRAAEMQPQKEQRRNKQAEGK